MSRVRVPLLTLNDQALTCVNRSGLLHAPLLGNVGSTARTPAAVVISLMASIGERPEKPAAGRDERPRWCVRPGSAPPGTAFSRPAVRPGCAGAPAREALSSRRGRGGAGPCTVICGDLINSCGQVEVRVGQSAASADAAAELPPVALPAQGRAEPGPIGALATAWRGRLRAGVRCSRRCDAPRRSAGRSAPRRTRARPRPVRTSRRPRTRLRSRGPPRPARWTRRPSW